MINLQSFLVVGMILFLLGIFGILTRKNAIALLMGIELMLNGVALTFAAFDRFIKPAEMVNPIDGKVFVIFIIILAAAEAAIALAIIIQVFGRYEDINLEDLKRMKE